MKYQFIQVDNVFDDAHCNRIIDEANQNGFKQAEVQQNNFDELGQFVDTQIIIDTQERNCYTAITPIQKHKWTQPILVEALRYANSFFQFDINGITDLHVIRYDEGAYFKPHLDIYLNDSEIERKITFIIQLSNPQDYTGGNLQLYTHSNPDVMPKDKGSLIAFPSLLLHEVSPILSGQRYACVGWCYGPAFK